MALTGVAATVVTALVAPGLEAVAAGREADGTRSFALGDGGSSLDPAGAVTLTPEAGWWVEPRASTLWLSSPDRALGVELRVVSEREARDALEGARAGGDPLLTETLASGALVRHVTEAERFVALAQIGDTVVLLEAAATPEAALADYRVALGRLLDSLSA